MPGEVLSGSSPNDDMDNLAELLGEAFVPLTEIGALASQLRPEDFTYLSERLGWSSLSEEYPELQDTIAQAQSHWSGHAA